MELGPWVPLCDRARRGRGHLAIGGVWFSLEAPAPMKRERAAHGGLVYEVLEDDNCKVEFPPQMTLDGLIAAMPDPAAEDAPPCRGLHLAAARSDQAPGAP